MCLDRVKLILNHAHTKVHCVDFLQQNFNLRILSSIAWHISSFLLSAVSLVLAVKCKLI